VIVARAGGAIAISAPPIAAKTISRLDRIPPSKKSLALGADHHWKG